MVRTILGGMGVLVGLALAVASVGVLIWLLWWLWTHRDEETETIEVELELPELEPVGEPAVAEVADRAATLDLSEEEPAQAQPEEAEAPAVEEKEAATEVEAPQESDEPPTPDKLTRIEGIGPKISSVLQAAGITTFSQLADTTPEQIEQILEESDPRLRRLAKPATWPEQAALAASGEWEALTALQKEFKRGQRA
jgi:predicted flap endonuclease-1-like 5' DNA nuclease